MKKLLLPLLLICFFFNAASAQDKKLDDILNKHYKAINQKKLSAVQTNISKGKVLQGGQEIPITFYHKRPAKLRIDGTFQGVNFVSAYDGQKGWKINPFMNINEPQPMTSEELDQAKDQADPDGFLYEWKEKGLKLELLPEEVIDSIKLYPIKVTKPNNDVLTNYINPDTYLLVKIKSKVKIQGVDSEVESNFSNFKTVDGIVVAFDLENKVKGVTVVQIKMDEMSFDKDVPDSLFIQPKL